MPTPARSFAFLLDETPALADAAWAGLAAAERELQRLISSTHAALAGAAGAVAARHGKRLRPLLAILGALAVDGHLSPAIVRGAAAIEALHLASLLHDDVIDKSAVRSGRPTVNACRGDHAAVLLGDFFFARALQGAAAIEPICLRRFLRAAETLVGGEFGQAAAAGRLPTVRQYFSWIKAKTASLFALAASLGQGREQASLPAWRALRRYGSALGLAYQLRDDLLDISGREAELGKPALSDYRHGVFTYPVIMACRRERALIGMMLEPKLDEDAWRDRLRDILADSGAFLATAQICRRFAGRAQQKLTALPPSAPARALAGLAAWVGNPRFD